MAPSRAKTGTWPVLTDLTRDQLSRCVAHAPTENTLWEQNPYKEPAAAWTSRVHGAESGSEKQSEPCRSRAWRCFAGTTKTGHSQSPFSRRGGGGSWDPLCQHRIHKGPKPCPGSQSPFPKIPTPQVWGEPKRPALSPSHSDALTPLPAAGTWVRDPAESAGSEI